jgi:hypothetical protein
MGDLAELEALPEDSPLLPMVTSTAENCLGSECPFWSECFVVQARQRAQSADLVVVNHHLLLADLALKQEGFGEILPGAQAFVVDEAHQLPELAAQFFGEGLGARPLVGTRARCDRRVQGRRGALAVVQQPAQQLEHATRVCARRWNGCRRAARARALHERRCARRRRGCGAAGRRLARALREASPGFDACHARTRDFSARCRAGSTQRTHRTRRRNPTPVTTTNDGAEDAGDVLLVRALATRLPPAAHAARRVRPAARIPRALARGVGVHVRDAGGRRRFRPPRERVSAWKIRARCCNPVPSTGRSRRCATCRRAARADVARLRRA